MIDFNDASPQNVFEHPTARKARVEQQLKQRIREYARYLFPHATFTAKDARIGDLSGVKGLSLSISLTSDESCGRWIDHATGERGDVFTLYARVHNLDASSDFTQIVAECDQWLNGKPAQRAEIRHKAEAARPAEPEPTKILEASYTYKDKSGRKVAEVKRFRLSNGKKTFLPFTNGNPGMPAPRPLYNLDRWHASESVVLVEGEKCADALTAIGIDATTLMGGANSTIEKTDLTPLAGKTVLLWPDHDHPRPKPDNPNEFSQPGYELMARLVGPLTAMGCTVRTLTPPKDKPDGWDAADAIAEGFDVASFLKAPADPQDTSIVHELWPDIIYQYEPELVEELFPRVGLATIYGPSTVGKSFLALDWMAAIATGNSLFGRDTEAVGVLYLAFEGFHGIKKRIAGIKQERGMQRVALELVDAPWTLSDPQDWQGLRAHVEAARARLDDTGYPLGIITVDTLTAAYAGIDANSQAEVTRAMKQLKRLAMDLGVLVLVIGHTGKDTTRGMAGSFAYKSESDTFIELQVERDELDDSVKRRSVFVEKVKDGASDYTLSDYDLREIRIGTKPNGKPITTCVVDWKPAQRQRATQDTRKPLSKSARLVVSLLTEGPKFVKELVEETGLKRPTVQLILSDLAAMKQVYSKEADGAKLWYVLETEATPHDK